MLTFRGLEVERARCLEVALEFFSAFLPFFPKRPPKMPFFFFFSPLPLSVRAVVLAFEGPDTVGVAVTPLFVDGLAVSGA